MARGTRYALKQGTTVRTEKQPVSLSKTSKAPPVDATEQVRGLIGYQLRRAHTLFALHWQLSFQSQGISVTPMQGGMLLVIDSRRGLSQTALAHIMDVEGPTLLEALVKLEGKGLVVREEREGDRRSYVLMLTEAGRNAVAHVKKFVPDREADLLVDLSNDERALLGSLLQRVVSRGKIVTVQLAAEKQSKRIEPAKNRKGRANKIKEKS